MLILFMFMFLDSCPNFCNALPYIPLHEGERSWSSCFSCLSHFFPLLSFSFLWFILVTFYFFFASGFPSLLGCFHRRLLWGCGDIQTGNLTSLILFCAKFGMHKIEEFGEFWSWNGWEDGFTCEWMQI